MANRARNTPGSTPTTTKDVSPLDKLQVYYEEKKKTINTVTTVVLVVAVALFGYFRLYKAPREEKAAAAMYFAERYYEADSLDRALKGDGQHTGMLTVIKRYDGTSAANLARYYAGLCYLHMNDFNNAVKYLKDFNGKGTIFEYTAYGNMGDAYMEMGNIAKGIESYNKAVAGNNDVATPFYLYHEAKAYEQNKQYDEAKKAYMRIRDEYPTSNEARNADKYLAALGELKD